LLLRSQTKVDAFLGSHSAATHTALSAPSLFLFLFFKYRALDKTLRRGSQPAEPSILLLVKPRFDSLLHCFLLRARLALALAALLGVQQLAGVLQRHLWSVCQR